MLAYAPACRVTFLLLLLPLYRCIMQEPSDIIVADDEYFINEVRICLLLVKSNLSLTFKPDGDISAILAEIDCEELQTLPYLTSETVLDAYVHVLCQLVFRRCCTALKLPDIHP